VIKKPRERGGHSPRWAAEPEMMMNCQKMGSIANEYYERYNGKEKGRSIIVSDLQINS
jgi:hypothetical protein